MTGNDKRKLAVVAIGGNSLIPDKSHMTVEDQYEAAHETCVHIADMIEQGWTVAVTHGNGPQVGFILRRSEISRNELHQVPLDACDADTQGAIGYAIQQNLYNEFLRRGMDIQTAYLNTLTTTGEAVSLTGVMLAVGVATWIWSPIKFQADMGLLLTFMFLWNMVGALWLLPALAHFLVKVPKDTEQKGNPAAPLKPAT